MIIEGRTISNVAEMLSSAWQPLRKPASSPPPSACTSRRTCVLPRFRRQRRRTHSSGADNITANYAIKH